jgi:putative transposase
LIAALLALIPRLHRGGLRLVVSPATILRWHRDLVRRRWAAKSRPRRPGRRGTQRNITRLVLRMARENEHWGYRRITGELAGLGIAVAASTVWEILKKYGVDPAPRRDGPGWAEFLRSQAQAILALDLFTVDLLNGTKAYVLAAIDHASRRIHILGATAAPGGQWIVQQARNLLMDLDDTAMNIQFVLHDRDATFHAGFDRVFTAAGIQVLRSGVRMPRMNSIIERWIGSCRRELLDRTLAWNLTQLRRVMSVYERHHNQHRPHRALAGAAPLKPLPPPVADLGAFRARRHDHIGGVIREYRPAAWTCMDVIIGTHRADGSPLGALLLVMPLHGGVARLSELVVPASPSSYVRHAVHHS